MLRLLKDLILKKQVSKRKSPACCKNPIYDGIFANTLIKGNGITSNLLI